MIFIDDAIFEDFDAVMAASAQYGGDVVIIKNATTITLKNVLLADLHVDDFSVF